ncbi:MAG: FAD:protein FMN transferase [Deltaproteobacteria bacterium]|jgi:thiamine biosynthesis lipoprotein
MKKMDEFVQHSLNRRSFLKLSGLLGLGVASAGVLPMGAEAVRFNPNMMKVSKTRLAMGTFVSMTLVHPSKDQAEEAMGQAFYEIDRLSGLLSRFDEQTAVAQLNREGRLKDVPHELARVVATALDYHRVTRGCFDITVKPVVDLFRDKLGGEEKVKPTGKELAQVLKLVGSEKIRMQERALFFEQPGMGITLDGIAKGYIVDRASQALTKLGIENHLINAGGDIRTRGSKAGNKPWMVAIQDPSKRSNYPDVIRMRDGAVATSGDYEIYFDREKMFHHIINPKTGLSPELSTSVSILAPTTMEADALATSVFVMTPEEGTRLINGMPNCESLVVARSGRISKSNGWTSISKRH